MKKFKAFYVRVRNFLASQSFNVYQKGSVIKSLLGAVLLVLLAFVPIITIIVVVLMQMTPLSWFYYVMMVVIFLCVILLVPCVVTLFQAILKNYPKRQKGPEDLQPVRLRDIFIYELINPLYWLVGVLFVVIVNYYLK